MPGAPVAGSRLTPEYVKEVGRVAEDPVITRQLHIIIDDVRNRALAVQTQLSRPNGGFLLYSDPTMVTETP